MEEEKWDSAHLIKRYSLESSIGSSPMSSLALNLEESARLRDTPKRRISWSSELSNTSPVYPKLLSLQSEDISSASPILSSCSPSFTVSYPDRSTPIQTGRLVPSILSNFTNKENLTLEKISFSDDSNRVSDEHDGCSRDSGISDKQDESSQEFIFTEPRGVPPRKSRGFIEEKLITISNTNSNDFTTKESPVNSEDDGFLEEIEICSESDASNVPSSFTQLIKGKLVLADNNTGNISRPPFHELCNFNVDTPKAKSSCIRGLFGATKLNFENSTKDKSHLKRQEISRDSPSPVQSKRRKGANYQRSESANAMEDYKILPKRSPLQRAFSDTHADIMKAVQKSVQEPNLIGDCSKPYVLPVLSAGRHQDLKMVSPCTVKKLLNGDYDDEISKYIIIDCRYPYEYDGGHIRGAINTYTKEGIINQFLCNPIRVDENSKRLVIVFHCEFSSERAPNLSRFLRNRDRFANKECYPHLYYPEIYVIEGGYKLFFEHHRNLCEPENYLPMLHKDHETDLRHFRAKSKSWNGEKGNLRFGSRPNGLNI